MIFNEFHSLLSLVDLPIEAVEAVPRALRELHAT